MRISKIGAAAAITCATVLSVLGSAPAQAVPASNGYLDAITLVGSDTIQDVDSALAAKLNVDASNTDGDRVVNVPAQFTGTIAVPGDRNCTPKTYAQTPAAGQVQSPNGSGAGKTALLAEASANSGCVDVGRSSSGRAGTDPSTLQYYAFARDALSYSASATGNAPQNLTTQQLRDVYSCTVTDWSQVGGTAGQIVRYIPQAGSGTRSFFINTVLAGADPTTVPVTASCPAVKVIQEHAANQVDAADAPNAVFPFSAAQWVAQTNKVRLPNNTVVPDNRGGFTIRAIDGQNPVSVTGAGVATPDPTVYNSTFIGGRFVFHTLDTRSPSYNDALRLYGFDGTGGSALCNGKFASTLAKFGFAPIDRASDAQGGVCRLM